MNFALCSQSLQPVSLFHQSVWDVMCSLVLCRVSFLQWDIDRVADDWNEAHLNLMWCVIMVVVVNLAIWSNLAWVSLSSLILLLYEWWHVVLGILFCMGFRILFTLSVCFYFLPLLCHTFEKLAHCVVTCDHWPDSSISTVLLEFMRVLVLMHSLGTR